MNNWRQTLSWRIFPERPVTVAFAQEPAITDEGRTDEGYVSVTYHEKDGLFEVEFGNDRGNIWKHYYYQKVNARQQCDYMLSRYHLMEVIEDHWDDYEE